MAKTLQKPKPILFKPTHEVSAMIDGLIDSMAIKNRTDALTKIVADWISINKANKYNVKTKTNSN